MIAGDVEEDALGRPRPRAAANQSLGQRLRTDGQGDRSNGKGKAKALDDGVLAMRKLKDGGMEMSFIPKAGGGKGMDDLAGPDYELTKKVKGGDQGRDGKRDKRVEKYGAGLEKGGYTGTRNGEKPETDAERKGRSERRHPGRSASKNVFRGL